MIDLIKEGIAKHLCRNDRRTPRACDRATRLKCQPASALDPGSARLGSGGKRRGRGEEFVGEGRQYCIGHARAAYDAVVILAAPCADGIKRHVGLFPNELESIEAGDALARCGVIDVRVMIGAASGWLGIAPCVVAYNACMT